MKWISNKDLLYSPGNSAPYYVAAWMGGEFRRNGHMRVWVIPFTVHLELPQHCFLCVWVFVFFFSLFFYFMGFFCFLFLSLFFITTLSTGYTPYKIKRLKKKSPFSPVEHPFSDTSRVLSMGAHGGLFSLAHTRIWWYHPEGFLRWLQRARKA